MVDRSVANQILFSTLLPCHSPSVSEGSYLLQVNSPQFFYPTVRIISFRVHLFEIVALTMYTTLNFDVLRSDWL